MTLTCSGSTCPSEAMVSSARPSARYSRSGSPPDVLDGQDGEGDASPPARPRSARPRWRTRRERRPPAARPPRSARREDRGGARRGIVRGRNRSRGPEDGRGGDHLDGRDEAIALAGNRLHEDRSLRRIAQRLPDLADGGVDAGLDVDEDVLGPEPGDDVAPRDELAPPLDQQDEEVHRLPLEPYRLPFTPQLVGRDVQLEGVKAERLGRFGGRHRDWREYIGSHKSSCSCGLLSSRRSQGFLQPRSMVKQTADRQDACAIRAGRQVGRQRITQRRSTDAIQRCRTLPPPSDRAHDGDGPRGHFRPHPAAGHR